MEKVQLETEISLRPFNLTPSKDPAFVFESPLIQVANKIRGAYRHISYDHRPEGPEWDKDFAYLQTDQFRRGYACFKYAVAMAIQPNIICEIGVGAGTGARAFMAACPKAHYIGIDDGSKNMDDGYDFIGYTERLLKERGYSYEIVMHDSMKLRAAPRADLFHVDGCHLIENAYNDTRLAVESESEWILIDDTRDFKVVAGAMAAVADHRRWDYDWTEFEDTWTGSILLHRR